MNPNPVIISLPIADRFTSCKFYQEMFELDPTGKPAEDGLPEPLQFPLNDGLRLMLVPRGGFGWVIGDNKVAEHGSNECVLSIDAASASDVDRMVRGAVKAGGETVNEPARQDWGYTGTFSDPDGHLWMVIAP